MTVFDIFVLAAVAETATAGALRGLVRALVAGAALAAGLVVAVRDYEAAGARLLSFCTSARVRAKFMAEGELLFARRRRVPIFTRRGPDGGP